jgi:hypothetical protein
MAKHVIISCIILAISVAIVVIFLMYSCNLDSQQILYVHGQSSVHSADWKAKIHLNQTTEQELLSLLGQPTSYYHRMPNTSEKYLLYSSIATVVERQKSPIKGTTEKHTTYEAREWFLISKGVLTEHLSAEDTEGDPDLSGFIASSGSD